MTSHVLSLTINRLPYGVTLSTAVRDGPELAVPDPEMEAAPSESLCFFSSGMYKMKVVVYIWVTLSPQGLFRGFYCPGEVQGCLSAFRASGAGEHKRQLPNQARLVARQGSRSARKAVIAGTQYAQPGGGFGIRASDDQDPRQINAHPLMPSGVLAALSACRCRNEQQSFRAKRFPTSRCSFKWSESVPSISCAIKGPATSSQICWWRR
jgi:hypothetical protein